MDIWKTKTGAGIRWGKCDDTGITISYACFTNGKWCKFKNWFHLILSKEHIYIRLVFFSFDWVSNA